MLEIRFFRMIMHKPFEEGVYRVSEKKLCDEKVPSLYVNRKQLQIKHK